MQELIKQARAGNMRAFKKLYQRKKDTGFKICLALCNDRDDATEACQNGFINIYNNLENLQNPKYFDSWFYRIMVNASYDLINSRKHANQDTDLLEHLEDHQTDRNHHLKLILKALEYLPEGYCTVFILHFFQGLKHREIGQILKISPATSRSQFARAKTKIKGVLSQKMEINYEEK